MGQHPPELIAQAKGVFERRFQRSIPDEAVSEYLDQLADFGRILLRWDSRNRTACANAGGMDGKIGMEGDGE